jgi:hypothetical protein
MPPIFLAVPDRRFPQGQLRGVWGARCAYETNRTRSSKPALSTTVRAVHNARARRSVLGVTWDAPCDGSAATGCGGGGRAAALDAGSISDATAASDWRDMIGLFNARKSARVSSLLCLLRAGDSMAEIVRRRPTFG